MHPLSSGYKMQQISSLSAPCGSSVPSPLIHRGLWMLVSRSSGVWSWVSHGWKSPQNAGGRMTNLVIFTWPYIMMHISARSFFVSHWVLLGQVDEQTEGRSLIKVVQLQCKVCLHRLLSNSVHSTGWHSQILLRHQCFSYLQLLESFRFGT